jgi:hypothetical protein
MGNTSNHVDSVSGRHIETLLQHGIDWDGDHSKDWIVTEELDGIRCYFDARNAWSKEGNRTSLPPAITLPATPLDGEIYAGHGRFEEARRAVGSRPSTKAGRNGGTLCVC